MATIFKRSETRPIPEGATIETFRGRRSAKWLDARTNKARRAPLNEAGDKIIQEAACYSIMYFDATGKRRQVSAQTSDKETAEQLARKLETEAAERVD